MPTDRDAVAEIRDLRIDLISSGANVVDDVSLDLRRGELVGLVGESGSGKTTVGTALLAHVRRGAKVVAGRVMVDDVDLLELSDRELRARRGRVVAYVPQDPATALTPSMRVGEHLSEPLDVHEPELGRDEQQRRIRTAMDEVGLPSDEGYLRRFVHELSGGQLQRVAIAMAFVTRPAVIVLDEPTTGLDVSTQARILTMVKRLCEEHRTAGLYVSHDLAVIAEIVDRIAVMYAGRIIEMGTRDQVLLEPAHPYTRLLFSSSPDITERKVLTPIPGAAPTLAARPSWCGFAARCPSRADVCLEPHPALVGIGDGHTVRCVRHAELAPAAASIAASSPAGRSAGADAARAPVLSVAGLHAGYGGVIVLSGVSIDLQAGECVAIVGQSGSGKTTLARCIVGAMTSYEGTVSYSGAALARRPRSRTAEQRRAIQYVFQNPYGALNPRRSVREILLAQLRYLEGARHGPNGDRVVDALERVALPRGTADRYPAELSGGERQRVGIARALICEPRVLICDEITSALDVSVQASIVNLLDEIRRSSELAVLFITHNIALVRSIADRVLVMMGGEIVEAGTTDNVLDHAASPYTRTLVAETPSLASARAGADPDGSGHSRSAIVEGDRR